MLASLLPVVVAALVQMPAEQCRISIADAAPIGGSAGGSVLVRVTGPTGMPLENAQVSVVGSTLGAISNPEGRALILQVPVGTQRVSVQLIGYGQETRPVSVTAGGIAEVDIIMSTRAVQLEGVVVTGTAIASQHREIGNTVSVITSGEVSSSGAMNFEDLLRGRALGVTVQGLAGAEGSNSEVVLRAVNSVNGRNRPLIFIDGIRVPVTGPDGSGARPLDLAVTLGALDPGDIDRMEIIKGSAATSLYGTDASAGVIHILTKEGRGAEAVRELMGVLQQQREGVAPPAAIALTPPPAPAAPVAAPVAPAAVAPAGDPEFMREAYALITENPFLEAGPNPLSTFGIDVDRASYANVRRFINDCQRPPIDAIRVEELINYFSYADPEPLGDVPFSITTEIAPAPWQPRHQLVRIALKGRSVDMEHAPPSNLVFLIDVSGSMRRPEKLPLLKTAFQMLVEELRPQDRVAIVVYAGAAGLVLPSTPGVQKQVILQALDQLRAGGSTAGGAGLALAYQIAGNNHVAGGNNRVILATDGDFNVGPSSDSDMVRLIEEKREQGTFLTVLGFGKGNLQDAKMEQIADHGNGNFAYIDGPAEAHKVLVEEMGGTLLTVSKDVKIQVEFNPAHVAAYRLIGYENRLLAAKDFADDTKDAGELGAGHSVTAFYEVVPVGVDGTTDVRGADELRYQRTAPVTEGRKSEELLFVKLRHKAPDSDTSQLITQSLLYQSSATPSESFRFGAAVAAWGMILRGSPHVQGYTLQQVHDLAVGALGEDPSGHRGEFLQLVDVTDRLEFARARRR